MSSSVEKPPESESFFNSQMVIYTGITWGVLSLLLFVAGVALPEVGDSLWYLLGTYVAECVPFLAAVGLCYRNLQSPKIVSGRNVWLCLGLGVLSYLIADLIFGVWEVYWGLDPEVSPADLFYMAFYILLGAGMLLAVLSRRLNLEGWQWGTLSVIAVVGTTIAVWVALAEPVASVEFDAISQSPSFGAIAAGNPATEQSVPSTPADSEFQGTAAPQLPTKEESEDLSNVPRWVLSSEDFLLRFSNPVNFFYIICDVALLIISAMLLLAFWGGAVSLSWRMIAAAALAKYVADMALKYTATLPAEYQSGGLLEVFFVFSGILFAIGAALEYDISSRPRKRRTRASRKTEVA